LKIILFPQYTSIILSLGFPQWFSSKESTSNARAIGDVGLIPGSRKSPGGGRKYHFTELENVHLFHRIHKPNGKT